MPAGAIEHSTPGAVLAEALEACSKGNVKERSVSTRTAQLRDRRGTIELARVSLTLLVENLALAILGFNMMLPSKRFETVASSDAFRRRPESNDSVNNESGEGARRWYAFEVNDSRSPRLPISVSY